MFCKGEVEPVGCCAYTIRRDKKIDIDSRRPLNESRFITNIINPGGLAVYFAPESPPEAETMQDRR